MQIILVTINHLFAQFDVFNYCYLSQTIQLNISHLFTHNWMIKQFYFKQFNLALVNQVKWFQEMQFLQGSGCIDTAIWMRYMDAN